MDIDCQLYNQTSAVSIESSSQLLKRVLLAVVCLFVPIQWVILPIRSKAGLNPAEEGFVIVLLISPTDVWEFLWFSETKSAFF